MKSNEKFTQRAELAIENARLAAGEMGHGYIGTVSMPLPEKFLPISWTIRTSVSGIRRRGIRLLAYSSKSGSFSKISSAGMTSIRQVWSNSFSMGATPKMMLQLAMNNYLH